MAVEYNRKPESWVTRLVSAVKPEPAYAGPTLGKTPVFDIARTFENLRDKVDALMPKPEPVNTRVPEPEHSPNYAPVQAAALRPKYVASPAPAADVGHTPAHVPVHVPRAAMVPTPFGTA